MKYENYFSLIEEVTIANSAKTALGLKTSLGWNEFTYKGLGLLSRKLACYLIDNLKIQKGERLAILSESRPEYGACVFGSVLAGLTTVPLDNKLTIYELKSILSDCEPTILLISSSNIEKGLELQKSIPSIKYLMMMEKFDESKIPYNLYNLPGNYETAWRRRPLRDTAFIIYTSGTTGAPKGVEISYKNMLAQMHDLRSVLKQLLANQRSYRMLSILPMNHLFELTVGFFTFLNHGFSIYYAKSLKPADILDIMTEKQIEFMITVPAFLKLFKTSIESELSKKSLPIQMMFKFCYEISRFLPICVRKLLFKSIHQKFGGKFFGCITGGAPLDPKVGQFFERIGIVVYQGYGLSEASPVVAVNRGKYQDIKSVGPVMPSLEAKVDESTGELMLKGPSIMKGYYKRPELTNEVINAEGWLHTGDIAKIDEHGLIFITGRIKNMIVLSGGKKVFPEEIESVLEQSPNFAEVCVMGIKKSGGEKDGCEEIVAVIVPRQICIDRYEDIKELEHAITNEVKTLSLRLATYKRPTRIIVKTEQLPKTTTNKLKRKEIKEMIAV